MNVHFPKIKKDHPINQIFQRIEIRAPLRRLEVLEPFGGDGASQTVHYAWMPCISRLEAWDLDKNRAQALKNGIPGADVKVCNAFEQVGKLPGKFDVVVIDNNVLQAPYEHFNLFPAIFGWLKDKAFMVVSVCPDPGSYYVPREGLVRGLFGDKAALFVKGWDAARAEFYGFPAIGPDMYQGLNGRIMPLGAMAANDMVPVYTEKAVKAGFFTRYQTVIDRSIWMKYILLELEKVKPKADREQAAREKVERQDAQARKP